MSLVDCKVELGLNAFQYSGGNFVLDSATLGVLGSSRLSGLAWYDVSDHVNLVNVDRGRSRQLDYFKSGSATVYFNNADRLFDPLNTASIFYPGVEPRCLIRVSARSQMLFMGFVNDWDLTYDIANQDSAVAYCADAFAILANQALSAFTPTAQLTGARIDTILNRSEVQYRGPRAISDGVSTVGAYAVSANTNVMNALRQVERSELGNLFVSADGTVVFRQRGEPTDVDPLMFADDGSGIPYQTLDNQYGDELMYNYIRTQSPAGTEQIASDATSIAQYQVSQLVWDDLLNSTTTDVSGIGKVLLTQFKNAKVRFTGFSVQLAGLSDADKDSVLGAELTDLAYIKKSFAAGSPSTYTQLSVLTGISHQIRPESHQIRFSVENADFSLFLILGDDVSGQLDFGILDF